MLQRMFVRTMILWLFALGGFTTSASAEKPRPNIVLIMTDNHGAWTLGCYGNQEIRTPHIDRLAVEGSRFTRAFASNPVCSPTRATFLTGLIPSQHGVHCFLGANRLQIGPEARCTLDQFTSLPEVLKESGYACGLVGKWHLGKNLTPQEGFEDYWITMPHGGTTTFYNAPIIENGKIRKEPKYLTEFWTDHAVKYIDQQANQDKPFFLFLSYNGPYALGQPLTKEGQNRHAAYYADKMLPSFPREPTHPWQFSNREYINNLTSIRRVATEVSGVDDGVGRVMEALKKHKLDENTLVIFVADQGWVGGHGGFFGMGDHTRPLTARDGMMQIPMIWRHPQQIKAHHTPNIMVTNYDFLPTLLNYLNLEHKLPTKPKSPGRDFSKALTGQAIKQWDNKIFYEFENLRCIRNERWKYIHRHPNGPHELYDLKQDPQEFQNLFNQPLYAEIQKELNKQLNQFYQQHAQPKYNLWTGGISQTRLFSGIDETMVDPPAQEPPPLPKNFQPQNLHVPKGYEVELVAGPPLVTHPTMACLDDQGRLFVCNNAGVNMSAKELEENLPNTIRMLEDTDNDGRFDRATVFADKMTYPMGAAWHDGALYVASPPNIWRLEDTTGDGVADQREILVSQFGYTGNAASIHGCFTGPDGRLYWCDGYHGHEFRDQTGKITSQREGSYIFSCRTDGSDVRLHCGGGMDNPVEVDFTREGEILGTVNILYTRPRVDCLVHWLYGGAYPHRERVLKEIKTTGDLLTPMHKFGHVAVSGTMRYRSGVLDHHFRDNYFATFFNSGKVVRVELKRSGSTYQATQREFLSCESRDFHPTDVLEDADGSLLVIDTGGWFYRGCPTSQHAKPEVQGAIYRIRRQGMTPLVDPWGKRINWSKLEHGQLAKLLNDTRFKVREKAIAECVKRGESIVPTLTQSIQRRDIRERLGAVWAITRMIGETETPTPAMRKAIRLALEHRSPSIRLATVRSLATYPDAGAFPKLIELLETDEPSIRREAAKALGRLGDKKAVPVLLTALGNASDRSENHALIYALIELGQVDATLKGLGNPSTKVNRSALIAVHQLDPKRLGLAEVSPLIDSQDVALRETVVGIYQQHAAEIKWADSAAKQLAAWLKNDAIAHTRTKEIQQLSLAFARQEPVAKLLGQLLNDRNTSQEIYQLLLATLASGNSLPLHNSWATPLEAGLKSDDPERIQQTIAAIAGLETDRFRLALQQLGGDQTRGPLIRVLAIEAASARNGQLSDSAFTLLVGILNQGTTSPSLMRSIQLLGNARLTKPQLLTLAPLLKKAGPVEIQALLAAYQRSTDQEVGRAFLSAMEQSQALLSVPANQLSDVVKRYPADLRDRANVLLDRIKQEEQHRLTRLDQIIPLLKTGNAERGKKLFFSEKSKCASCHRVNQQGETIGPDLTTIGANRSSSDLLESVIFPSATFVRDYQTYLIATTNGQSLSGLIVRDTGEEIFVQQQLGKPVRVLRSQIEDMRPSTVSIMPNGLEKALTEEELVDVIAYLQSLKAKQNE